MSKKPITIFIITIISIIIGYYIFNLFNTKQLIPIYSNDILKKSEYYNLIVAVVSAGITFIAIIVALFKDDLRDLWRRPKIKFCSDAEMTVEDLSSFLESDSSNNIPTANRYISRIEVRNTGNMPALNAEIYLETLFFTPKDSSISEQLECSGSALKWNGGDSNTIIIPPGGKKLIKIAQIIPSEKTSTPESQKTTLPSTLSIGEIDNVMEHSKGKWNATFCFYAQNHKPISFKVQIEWNGIWKSRLAEFKKIYQITQIK